MNQGNQKIDSQNLAETNAIPPTNISAPISDAKPAATWTKHEVVDWAKKILVYSDLFEEERLALDDSLKVVISRAINGAALLLFKSEEQLQSKLDLLDGHAMILWAAIEKLKNATEPPKEELRSLKRKRDDATYESDEDYPIKRSRLDKRRQSFPPDKLNLSQRHQQKAVRVVLQSLFIGRTKELNTLVSDVEENLTVLYFRPTTLVISGPCGIGKSHLALKLIEQAKFHWSLTITATPDSNPNQLLWEELGMKGPSIMNNFEIFSLIVRSLPGKDSLTNPFKIAIYFDEIHHLKKQDLRALQHDIKAINSTLGTNGLIQLILTGVSTTFISLELGEEPSAGAFRVINLQPFTRNESIALLHAALDQNIGTTGLTSHDIEHAIGWFGGNPRLIQFAASHLKQNPAHSVYSLINSVTESFSTMYISRLAEKQSVYPIITAACLSQLPVRYNDVLGSKNTMVKVSHLVQNGIVGFKPLSPVEAYGADTLGYLTISLLEVRKFVSMNNLYFNVPLLMDPKQWTWSQFEVFVAEMLNIKIRAFWSLGRDSVKISEMFPGVPMSPDILELEINISHTPDVMTLTNQCKSYQSIKTSYESTGRVMPKAAVFLNAPLAPSWDVAYVRQEQLELVVQVKHTTKEDGGEKVTATLIKEELAKMPANIPCLFLTNRTAEENIDCGSYKNLILVTRANLAAFLGMFWLHRFTDAEMTEATNSVASSQD